MYGFLLLYVIYCDCVHVQQSDRLAVGLMELGVQKGDRVGIWSPNCIEWIIVQYATARAGFILVRLQSCLTMLLLCSDVVFGFVPWLSLRTKHLKDKTAYSRSRETLLYRLSFHDSMTATNNDGHKTCPLSMTATR